MSFIWFILIFCFACQFVAYFGLFIHLFASFFIHFHVRRPISDICKQFDKLAGLLPCNIYVHKIVKAIEKIINPKNVKTNENKTKRVGGVCKRETETMMSYVYINRN